MLKKQLFCVGISVCMFAAEIQGTCAYLDRANDGATLFRQLSIVLGLLNRYEMGDYTGVTVDFGTTGKYYSRFLGENWWQYYFKKIEVGDTLEDRQRIKTFENNALSCSLFQLDAQRAHELIQKYIVVQPLIAEKVSTFQAEQFKNSFVIGVEYVKNDASAYSAYSTPKIPYKQIYEILLIHLLENPTMKIFVHTDDPRFYTFLKVKHPDNVVQYRTKTHFEMPADEAESELINCLLLAQVDMLLCTPSLLSLTVAQFNPSLPMIQFGELAATKAD